MLKGLLVESGQNPAPVLKDFFRSPGKVSLFVDSIRTPSGVYLESSRILEQHTIAPFKRGPGGLQVDSRWTPGRLQIQYQEFTWTPDGVHQDPWLSVTTSASMGLARSLF